MDRDSKNESKALPHGLSLQDRSNLTLSGVNDVANFDENQVVVITSMGTLNVRGSELHVDQLNLERGELKISGSIDQLEYDDRSSSNGGLLRRLFQ